MEGTLTYSDTVVPFKQTLSLLFVCVYIHKRRTVFPHLTDHSYHHRQQPSTAALLSLEGGMDKPESTKPSIAHHSRRSNGYSQKAGDQGSSS